MRNNRVITAIDLGTNKCATLISTVNDDGVLQVLGISAVNSRGVKRSVIVDLEAALSSISESLDAAERMAGFDISSAYVSISGPHVTSRNSKGVVAVADPESEITAHDVERVIEAARAVSLPADRRIVHVVPRDFKVDSQDGIKDPVGMTGVRLESEAHIITGMNTSLRNLEKCLNDLGLAVDGFVFSALSSSNVVLSETEKELGVAVVDIGAGSTNFCVFTDGTLIYSGAIPIGARHITQDIALGCRISLKAAEKIKLHLTEKGISKLKPKRGESKEDFNKRKKKADKIDLDELGITETKDKLSKKIIFEGIMIPRMQEIVDEIGMKLEKKDLLVEIPAGFVLCGGGAETIGFTDVVKKVLRLPARIGKPERIDGMIADIQKPAFSTSIGLLQYGKRNIPNGDGGTKFNFGQIKLPLKGMNKKIIKLIKSLFP